MSLLAMSLLTMSLLSDPRLSEAATHLPDYLGNHLRVSIAALALGLAVSLPLAILARNRPVMRGALLTVASIVQTVPGLALLACSTGAPVADRVRALRGGADDWVTKPCHPDELVARIQAILRRPVALALAGERGSITYEAAAPLKAMQPVHRAVAPASRRVRRSRSARMPIGTAPRMPTPAMAKGMKPTVTSET